MLGLIYQGWNGEVDICLGVHCVKLCKNWHSKCDGVLGNILTSNLFYLQLFSMDSMIKQSIQKAVIQLEDKTDNSQRATKRIMIIHNLLFQDHSRTTCEYKWRPRVGWGFLFTHGCTLHIAKHRTGEWNEWFNDLSWFLSRPAWGDVAKERWPGLLRASSAPHEPRVVCSQSLYRNI